MKRLMLKFGANTLCSLRCAFLAVTFAAIGCGSATPVEPLAIIGPAAVVLGSSAAYQVQPAAANLTWSVDNVPGGSTSTGTIANGAYKAPSVMGTSETVMISCSERSGKSAQIKIQLQNPAPTIANVQLNNAGVWTQVVLSGTGFIPTSQIAINGTTYVPNSVSATQMSTQVPITSMQSNPIQLVVSNPTPGGGNSNPFDLKGAEPSVSIKAAARFLDQATFGPTMSDIQHVQAIGLQQYLDEQFSTPASLIPVEPTYANLTGDCRPFVRCWPQGWWAKYALWAPDQLRQKVAFALEEQWVVSFSTVDPYYLQQFFNVFPSDAFGNWRQLMQDVTLSPAMGTFLNMVNSVAPAAGQHADQNYAREVMQLFNLGPDRLNEDGSLQLDANGNPIPVYTPAQIDAFSRAFTGWTYQLETSDFKCTPPTEPISDNYAAVPGYGVTGFTCPMAPLDAYHDESEKVLLDGVTLPAGQTALEDLNGALDDIFNDPNLPPFVAQRLIQHLVMSNPPPDYIRRVADVFKDDGHGVRGNMKAVISAILLDPDARADDAYGEEIENGGKLREPLLWMISITRALGPQDVAPGLVHPITFLTDLVAGLGQFLMEPADVNGYFSPEYVIPGTSLIGPEFQLESTASIQDGRHLVIRLLNDDFFRAFSLDFSATGQLGQLDSASPESLVIYLDIVMMHGDMSAQMFSDILNAIQSESPTQAVKDAIYLIATSPEYKVMD